MCPSTFLPNLEGLALERVTGDADHITVAATARAPTAACPLCQHLSRRVHSTYGRTIRDLPWSATPVTLCVQVRRFFCTNRTCARKIFCERLERVAAAYG